MPREVGSAHPRHKLPRPVARTSTDTCVALSDDESGPSGETFASDNLLQITSHGSVGKTHDRKTMSYSIATILAVIAIIFVLITYITSAPLVPVAVILLGLAIIFGGQGLRRV